ncbi:hypothetical protein [Vibrio phage vB_VaM_H2]|nr:hypothetical protein [Vibrio phage vB_VaM_H2]
MSELKPCPFCGSKAKVEDHGSFKIVGCSKLSMLCPNPRMAVYNDNFHYWNQRTETETEKRLTAIATKHATVNDERYELLEKQKSDIEKMLDQLFKHEKVDGWLVCKMNDMLDDVNHQLENSRIEAEGE